jgi:serine/threonine-protein kinase HipA
MAEDILAVWLDGHPKEAGRLASGAQGEIAFAYNPDYIAGGGLPLSLSLPLRDEDFGDAQARAYFANLLPENEQLQAVIEREGIARNDVVALLHHFGADCAGAVSCLPIGAPPVKVPGVLSQDYEPLEDRALVKIVQSLAEARRLPADIDDPSPVAGVQSKIAITLLPGDRFALPKPGVRVPTTHILKVPDHRHGREAKLEEAAALLAAACGLDVSIPRAIKVGDYDALLIERFDRRVEAGVVTRVHQEDFAQALGFPSELKYERRGKPGRRFDVGAVLSVLDRTADPVGARLAFLQTTLLNLCIGNTDNHAKNHALLYDAGPTPRLAPLYDLLPIRLDRRYNHALSFNIGAADHFDKTTPDDFHAFLRTFGVEDVPGFVEEIVVPLIAALEEGSKMLRGMGLKTFDDLIGRETEELVERLDAALKIRERDLLPYAAGGWGTES